MGAPVKFTQTAVISSGGAQTISYVHDPQGKASRIGVIAAHIASGTQTGMVAFYYGNDLTNAVMIHRQALTATTPYAVTYPEFVIYPGQVIAISFSGVTAGDVARVHIGGH